MSDRERRFGTMLQEARQAAKLTQEQLGAYVNASQPTVSGWENGHILPTHSALLRLSEVLEVPVRRFLEAIAEDRGVVSA